MAAVMLDASPWTSRRRRAADLGERWPFSADVLTFYASLLDVQERVFDAAAKERPAASDVPVYVAERALPGVIDVSAAHGPATLIAGVLERFHAFDPIELVRMWLRGDELGPVDRYLARAATGPVLEALGPSAGDACDGPRDERGCPICGGPPQVAYFAVGPEDLVSAHRYLVCARCANEWAFARMTCAACGETDTARLAVHREIGATRSERGGSIVKGLGADPTGVPERALFPHVRIDGCTTCSRYLLTIDLERDGRAVPVVDEIAALPLDLYAKERGFHKIVPNAMGF
jgi:formate dehydrogenase maturation protein FdhE